MCDRATKITLKKTDTYTVTVRHRIGFYQLANKVAKRHFLTGMFPVGKTDVSDCQVVRHIIFF